MTRWNGPCKSRRTWEGIIQDLGNCQGAGANNPWEEAVQEVYDIEVSMMVEELLRAHMENYYTES